MLNRLFKNLFRENRVVWDESPGESLDATSNDRENDGGVSGGAERGELSEELLAQAEAKKDLFGLITKSVDGMDVSSIDSCNALEKAVKAKAEASIDNADSAIELFSAEVAKLAEESKLMDAISEKTKAGKKVILKVTCDDSGKLTIGVEEGVENPAEVAPVAPATPEPVKEELTQEEKKEILGKKKEIYAELVKGFTAPLQIKNPGTGAKEEMKKEIINRALAISALKESKIWELSSLIEVFKKLSEAKRDPANQFIAETFAEDAVKGVPESIWLDKTEGMVNQLKIAYSDAAEPFLNVTNAQVPLDVKLSEEQEQDYNQIKSKGLGFFGFILKLFKFVPDRADYAAGPAGEAAYRQAYDAALKAGVDGTDSFLNFALGLAGYKCGQQSIDQLKAMAPGHEAEIDQFVAKMRKYLGKLNVAGAENTKMIKAGDFSNGVDSSTYATASGLDTAYMLEEEYKIPDGKDLEITLDRGESAIFEGAPEVYGKDGQRITLPEGGKIEGADTPVVLVVKSGQKLSTRSAFSKGAVLKYESVPADAVDGAGAEAPAK